MKLSKGVVKRGEKFRGELMVRRKRFWTKDFPTIKEAEEARAELLTKVKSGELTAEGLRKVTLKDYSLTWLENRRKSDPEGFRETTCANYKERLVKGIIPILGDYLLKEVTPEMIKDFMGKRFECISKWTGKNITVRTVRYELTILKMIFACAYASRLILFDPARTVKPPKSQDKEVQIFTAEEMKTIIEKINPLFKVAVTLTLRTGCRESEIWGLDWKHFDEAGKQILIRQTFTSCKLRPYAKTQSSIRDIDIDPATVELLKAWRIEQGRRLKRFPTPDDPIFLSQNGKRVHHGNFMARDWRPIFKETGIPYRNFHCLRHTNASIRMKCESDRVYTRIQMGHKSTQILEKVYGHFVEKDKGEKQRKAENFGQACNELAY